MHVGELLYQVDKHGVTLHCGWAEARLHYTPAGVLPQDLVGLAVIVLLPFGERAVLTKNPLLRASYYYCIEIVSLKGLDASKRPSVLFLS